MRKYEDVKHFLVDTTSVRWTDQLYAPINYQIMNHCVKCTRLLDLYGYAITGRISGRGIDWECQHSLRGQALLAVPPRWQRSGPSVRYV